MPIYEYKCSRCAFQEEYLQKVSEPQLTKCPACGKKTFTKMLSAAGFHLKGSGWYATDFKGGGAKPAGAKGEAKTEAKGDAKVEASGEGKAAAKSETKAETKTAAKADSGPAGGAGISPACTTN